MTDARDAQSAMRWYASTRDDFALPLYDATKRLASFELDLDEIFDVLHEMCDEGECEAHFLANSTNRHMSVGPSRQPSPDQGDRRTGGWQHPCP